MVKIVPYEAFACPSGAGDIVLRELYKPKTRGSSSTPIYSPGSSTPPRYSSEASTPQSYSLGTSKNAECSNCKHLLDRITRERTHVRMMMGSGRWNGKIEELHWKTWYITGAHENREADVFQVISNDDAVVAQRRSEYMHLEVEANTYFLVKEVSSFDISSQEATLPSDEHIGVLREAISTDHRLYMAVKETLKLFNKDPGTEITEGLVLDAELLDRVFKVPITTVKCIPHGCRLAFSQALKTVLCKMLVQPDSIDAWVRLLLFLRCTLQVYRPKNRQERRSENKNHCNKVLYLSHWLCGGNMMCLRKVVDEHFTAAVKVLSSSDVAPKRDDTIKALEAKHPYNPPYPCLASYFLSLHL
nr:hypothetical protein [Tanacetum cinerariifolium]